MALSDLAEELLSAAAESEQGLIFISRDAEYQTVLIGNKDYVQSRSREQIAQAKAAVLELETMGYVTPMMDSFLFAVTTSGRQAAHPHN